MSFFSKAIKLVLSIVIFITVLGTCQAESSATRLLKDRNAEFQKGIIRVSSSVYTAVGYAVSPVSMVVGKDGIIIIDTGLDISAGKLIREDFRKIVDKPVKAIIFTHGHGDHTIGAPAFLDTPDVQVWAKKEFGHERRRLSKAGIKIQKTRGAMQAGFFLTPEQRINNGIAKAFWPNKKGKVFAGNHHVTPTHLLDTDRKKLSLAGIDLELVASNGETQDHLYVWFAKERIAFSGDNFYKSWPNLYAIRGTQYRDIRQWVNAIDQVLEEHPVAVVGGHTRPIIGEKNVKQTLTNYRDAVEYLFLKTVEGINKGMTPNQLVNYVKLPDKYQNLDYLRPYYGHPEWAIRAIFDGYLGWFDGNASNLFPLSDKDEAERIAKISGGVDALLTLVSTALKDNDYQWAAQLCDYILALEPKNKKAMLNKAEALTELSKDILTATARNYYLSSAMKLRKQAKAL